MGNENSGVKFEFEQTSTKETPKQERPASSFDETLLEIDNRLENLDFKSPGYQTSIGQSELEQKGRKNVKEQAGLIDRASLFIKEKFGSYENCAKKLNEMAEKSANKNLDDLERGLGADLITIKEKIALHEKNAKNDLEAVQGLKDLDPSIIEEVSSKLQAEKEEMEAEKQAKEQELRENTDGHPIFERQSQLEGLLNSYQETKGEIFSKHQELKGNIRNYEIAIKKLRVENEATSNLKDQLAEKLKTLKEQEVMISEREKKVVEKISSLQQEKKSVASFANRLNGLGKTKSELFAEQAAKRKMGSSQEAEKDIPGNGAGGADTADGSGAKGAEKVWQAYQSHEKPKAGDDTGANESTPSGEPAKPESEAEAGLDLSINKKTKKWVSELSKAAHNIVIAGDNLGINFDKFFQEAAKNKSVISAGKALEIMNNFLEKTGETKQEAAKQAIEYIKKTI